ncbi:MAG: DNA methyltransferase [Desulfovibrio sp.]|uniref:MT-A70 family methyltransferase n=1 Tax=Desulfovibrio sp. TaxID=885 RepID=UPI00135EDCEA|nr:MT-A70 family methyltransferase [Desulfovibrio sp.]MTJ94046.1 DNA methyltransferase [Desulfovibrio sp.]
MTIDRAVISQQFQSLRPAGGFRLIYADPPWSFANFSTAGEAKNPKAHYGCESVEDLKRMPVELLAAKDCVLAMWATFPMLPQALDLLGAWGFAYKAGGTWGKQSSTGEKIAFGTGYIFRSAAELLLVGTRGKPTWGNRRTRNLWLAPIREHSRKPDNVRDDMAALVPGSRIELFAREAATGWSIWGNETGKFDKTVAA